MATGKTVNGHITVVQEERFRLTSDDGQGFLFTLARSANTDAAALHRFHKDHTAVVVHYAGEPDLSSGVAHEITTHELVT